MPIPDYQTCMLPLLQFASDGQEHHFRDAVAALAQTFKLSEEERNKFLPSGGQAVFSNRVGWARTYLKKAGLLSSPKRSYLMITDRGRNVLKENPPEINVRYLERFPEFVEFKSPQNDQESSDDSEATATQAGQTPHEALETAYEKLRSELANDILQNIKNADPSLFENVVVELLVKMGYGGSREDAGKAIGRSGDEGIDGIIKEDHLGLDNIYVQAKRWKDVVGRPEIQKFAGALQGQRARKGIFITTSDFSKEAQDYVSRIDSRIILVNGKMFCRFMIDFGVGVTNVATYEIKKIDSDYFAEG